MSGEICDCIFCHCTSECPHYPCPHVWSKNMIDFKETLLLQGDATFEYPRANITSQQIRKYGLSEYLEKIKSDRSVKASKFNMRRIINNMVLSSVENFKLNTESLPQMKDEIMNYFAEFNSIRFFIQMDEDLKISKYRQNKMGNTSGLFKLLMKYFLNGITEMESEKSIENNTNNLKINQTNSVSNNQLKNISSENKLALLDMENFMRNLFEIFYDDKSMLIILNQIDKEKIIQFICSYSSGREISNNQNFLENKQADKIINIISQILLTLLNDGKVSAKSIIKKLLLSFMMIIKNELTLNISHDIGNDGEGQEEKHNEDEHVNELSKIGSFLTQDNRYNFVFNLLSNLWISRKIPKKLLPEIKFFIVFGNNILIVTYDDRVYGCGDNFCGRLGFGHKDVVENVMEINGLSNRNVENFFIGETFLIAITTDNYLMSWGSNHLGQCGRGIISDPDKCLLPNYIKLNIGDEKILEVSCGDFNAMLLIESGKVFVWGENRKEYLGKHVIDKNECNNKFITVPIELIMVNALLVKSVHISQNRFFITTSDTTVHSWGNNSTQCLGHSNDEIKVPTLIKKISSVEIIKVRSGIYNSYFLDRQGKLYFCGAFSDKGKVNYQQSPIMIETDKLFEDLENTNENLVTVALSKEKRVYELNGNQLTPTVNESIEEYCFKRWHQTYKTCRYITKYESNFS